MQTADQTQPTVRPLPEPRHVATNIDGSRRWAMQRGIPIERSFDYCFVQIQAICAACIREGIEALTLHVVRHLERTIRGPQKWREAIDDFARLSTEYMPRWQEQGIRLHLMGDIAGLPEPSRGQLVRVAELTAANDTLHLSMAINYSSRSDGIQAARRLAAQCAEGSLRPEDITESVYLDHLWSATLPAELRTVQMLIITGAVAELDDFMQREAALASVFFTDSLWPDFDDAEFSSMLERYRSRKMQPRSYETSIRALASA